MRWLFTVALALQQVPALTHGLAIPHGTYGRGVARFANKCRHLANTGIGTEELSSPSTQITLNVAPHTQSEINSPISVAADEGSPTATPAVVDDAGNEKTKGEDDLARELAELDKLRLRLAELEKEVYDRGRQLAEAAGVGGTDDDGDDGLWYPLLALLRKAKYAATAIINSNNHNEDGQLDQGNTTLPLTDTNSTTPEDTTGLGLEAVNLHLAQLLFLFIVLATVFHLVVIHVFGYGAANIPAQSLPLSEAAGREDRTQRRGFWARALAACRSLGRRRRQSGEILLGEGERDGNRHGNEYGYGYGDEKRRCMDEKDVGVFEDHDGDDGGCGIEYESESESEGDDEDGESTLEDEFASFRAALEMVDGIVAAEEGRSRAREA